MDSTTYWKNREAEQRKHDIKDEQEYRKRIEEIYQNMIDEIEKEINGFYGKYARQEGITMAEAKKRAAKLDIEAYGRKAAKYVKEKDFSKQANAEMRLYNLTMKVNRLELLKAQIGLEMVAGFDELQKYYDEKLTDRAIAEFERQAGILGKTIQNNAKAAKAIVNASFHNATFSDRIWMYQDMLKNELSSLLQTGLIQGQHPRKLATHLRKRFGVSQSNAELLMITEMARVQTEAQKQSFERNGFEEYTFLALGTACPICRALDGKHFKVKKMMPGTNASPMHPRCRCSAAAHEDSEDYEAWLDYLSKGGTTEEWNKLKKESSGMSATDGHIKWPGKKKRITKEQYKELSEYAKDKEISLEGFRRFDGDIQVIKQAIDDADEIAVRFPEIKSGRKRITISLDEHMSADDFAVTKGHIIHINADAFRNAIDLAKEYESLSKEGWFVKGTNYRSIIKHETGHVVANLYGIDGLDIAKKITGINSNIELMAYLEKNLSLYASEYEDGSEIISEVFSDVFGTGNPSEFSLRFMDECDKMKEKRK